MSIETTALSSIASVILTTATSAAARIAYKPTAVVSISIHN
jgi:hypothetical protein